MRWVIVAIGIATTGCAPMVWDRPEATQADFNRDSYGCERDARQSGYYGDGLTGAVNMQSFFERCMGAQGYALRSSAHGATSPGEPSADPGLPRTDEECKVRFGVKCPDWVKKPSEI